MEATIKKIDGYELSTFVKKLLPIDKFIFMKIGKEGTVSSVYFPERDAVKLVSTPTSDIFDTEINDPVKVSFYNGSKVIDALSHFNGDVQGRIKYSEIDGELMASDFTLANDDLQINLACADPSLSFMEMSKEETDRAFGTEGSIFEFDLLTTHVDKMKSLFNLEREEDTFTLAVNDKGVAVQGNSYDATLAHTYEGEGAVGQKVVIYKKYINLLDKENYKVIVCSNKVVFRSLDTNTHLTVAVAITDED
jgi:hypothetical protein|tara:strand:+ start:5840 stop:6589 length:750 start_codon:yes stop_codon:yes gene_type:complete